MKIKTILSPTPVIAFIGFWIFAAILYGDVFYMAEQYSLFAFDQQIMEFILDQPGGKLYWFGRLLLLSYHEPWIGGFLMSVLLTGTVCLVRKSFALQGKWEWISLLPSIMVLWYLIQKGQNLYYQQEPSVVFLWPLTVFILAALVSIAFHFIAGKPSHPVSPSRWGQGICGVLFLGLYLYTWTGKENERITASMQRAYQEQNWDKMIQQARQAKQPTRSVAAYHAIALLQTGRLLNNLLDIPYQYPDLGLINRGGLPDDGTDLYLSDCCLSSGLVNTAYHQAMERMVIDGPSCHTLKLLFFCSLLNEEYVLANKYLYLLQQVPFESGFVERYMPFVANPEAIVSHPFFNHILALKPTNDSFEQSYRSPIFIGYPLASNNIRNQQPLEISIAACLYTKLLDEVVNRTRPYKGKQLPLLVEQAVVLYTCLQAERAANLLSQFPTRRRLLHPTLYHLLQSGRKGQQSLYPASGRPRTEYEATQKLQCAGTDSRSGTDISSAVPTNYLSDERKSYYL